ncbi:hypothetical protein [Comamonas sp.]|uniref:hypothetical protein n=1 Tax=Comamonas sp. TaxID=34028 RepID=UPI0012C81B6D|nr:hypothetical protein [Comamonas sp.]MPS92821.1 hypothetical protein [Comamonas sp.]
MEKINLLSNFLVQTLNTEEINYLISELTHISNKQFMVVSDNNNSTNCEGLKKPLTLLSLTKREIDYKRIKIKLLVQKPKTVEKLKNSINQISKSDGGFSDEMINLIINELVVENIINLSSGNEIIWRK